MKFDIKNIAIIVLGIALIISFFFGQKSHIDKHEDEINALHKSNASLLIKNDSLKAVNVKLDSAVAEINRVLEVNAKQLAETQTKLNELKKKQNEVRTYVNSLSANGVTNAFSEYLKARTTNSVGN